MIDIKQLAAEHGSENLLFHVPVRPMHGLHSFGIPMGFTSSDDEWMVLPCRADETHRKIADGHKVRLQPIDRRFAYHDYYLSDLRSLMECNPEEYRVEVSPPWSDADQIEVLTTALRIMVDAYAVRQEIFPRMATKQRQAEALDAGKKVLAALGIAETHND